MAHQCRGVRTTLSHAQTHLMLSSTPRQSSTQPAKPLPMAQQFVRTSLSHARTHLMLSSTPRQSSTQPAKPVPMPKAQQPEFPRTTLLHARTHLMLCRPPLQFPSEHSVCLRLPPAAPAQQIKLRRSSRCLHQQFKRTEQPHRRLL
jgi:hypothetical protein